VPPNPERDRLLEHDAARINWKGWGPHLSERAWGDGETTMDMFARDNYGR